MNAPIWLIEYEIRPLRAIYSASLAAPDELEARRLFLAANPKATIRTVELNPAATLPRPTTITFSPAVGIGQKSSPETIAITLTTDTAAHFALFKNKSQAGQPFEVWTVPESAAGRPVEWVKETGKLRFRYSHKTLFLAAMAAQQDIFAGLNPDTALE